MDLVEFLTARYDEDEADARGAFVAFLPLGADQDSRGRWVLGESVFRDDYEFISIHTPGSNIEIAGAGIDGTGGIHSRGFAEHMVRHDPARVLADIAAKRAIVEDYQITMANNAVEKANDGDEVMIAARGLIAKSLRMVLLRLAAPYADHPDFDPAWGTDG